MTALWIALAVVGALLLIALALGLARRLVGRDRELAQAAIMNLRDSTATDARTGAVRSVQTADLLLSERALGELWSAANLERLGRTYWRFLTRVTLGLIRVRYGAHERSLVLLGPPLRLIRFRAPDYELAGDRGVVRWRIEGGLLVSGRAGARDTTQGHLQIDVRRAGARDATGRARVHVEVEVASFYPAIAFGLSRRLYDATQSRVHVIVTHGFLRSLARLDLAESRVGRLAQPAAGGADAATDGPDAPTSGPNAATDGPNAPTSESNAATDGPHVPTSGPQAPTSGPDASQPRRTPSRSGRRRRARAAWRDRGGR